MRDRQRDRDRQTETDSQRQTETDRQTERERSRSSVYRGERGGHRNQQRAKGAAKAGWGGKSGALGQTEQDRNR